MQLFPEIDRAEWFDLPAATMKMIEGQRPLLDRLADLERSSSGPLGSGRNTGQKQKLPRKCSRKALLALYLCGFLEKNDLEINRARTHGKQDASRK